MTNMIATLLMVLTYTYLYIQYRHSYLAKWMAAWILHEVRIVFLEKSFIEQSSVFLTILYIILSFAYCLLMMAGTMELVGRRLSKIWIATGLLFLVITTAGMIIHLPAYIYGIPGVFYIGTTYIRTGFIVRNINVGGMGRWLTTWAFILLGFHTFDMPVLAQIGWFIPWGYLIDGILRSVVAIGTVFIYFEKVKNELAQKEKYYRLLAENATDIIYRYKLTKPAGFEYISPAIKQVIGYEPGDIKTIREIMRIIHPDDRDIFKKFLKNPVMCEDFAIFRVLNKSGEIVWAEPKYSIVSDPNGKPIAIEGSVRDITKRVLLEQDVSRLDRLNIVGQMAANLAHEVRNPLTTVRGYLQLFGNKREFQHYKEQFCLLLDELDRTNHIITEYLSLSKNKSVEMKKCSLNEIVYSLHPLVQADATPSKIEIELKLGDIPNLYLDGKEIKQLVLNLTRNAIEAMPAGGRLGIQTVVSGDEIVLTVADQGTGIPQHVLDNLGKPFFTTKTNGTGLGMAICYRIAHRHNAKVDIDTGPAGTTINIRFRTPNPP
ncbi:ATP-binding protein [Sporomusa carbonis]|uniref:ATP-binding protein n=1 Tax=Sporomusa carbonis TaxID=3076075 RepID=UPI003C7C8DC4